MRARFGFERAPLDVASRLLVVQSQGPIGRAAGGCLPRIPERPAVSDSSARRSAVGTERAVRRRRGERRRSPDRGARPRSPAGLDRTRGQHAAVQARLRRSDMATQKRAVNGNHYAFDPRSVLGQARASVPPRRTASRKTADEVWEGASEQLRSLDQAATELESVASSLKRPPAWPSRS